MPRGRKLPVIDDPRTLGLRAWIQLARTFTRVYRQLEQTFESHGLTPAQFDVLATLRTGEGITQQELAGRLLVTKGNVVGVLDRLEQAGLIERRADPLDGRANRLYLRRPGRERLSKIVPDHRAVLARATKGLSHEALRALAVWLRAMEESLGEET